MKKLSNDVILSGAKNLVFFISIEILRFLRSSQDRLFHSLRMTKQTFLGVVGQPLKGAATRLTARLICLGFILLVNPYSWGEMSDASEQTSSGEKTEAPVPPPPPNLSRLKEIVSDSPSPSILLSQRTDIILISDFSRGMKKGAPRGWDLDDKKKPVKITLETDGEDWVIYFKSKDSAFGVYKELDFNFRDYPCLNWEWKVTELPVGGDFRNKDKDDQAAQVYVSFGSLSLFNKPFVKAVGYYWSSTAPVGTEGPCPTWGKSRVIVLQSGEEKLGQWVKEKRNVYRDYVSLFDDKHPSKVSVVRLYTNSQHTETGSEAYFKNIYFSKD